MAKLLRLFSSPKREQPIARQLRGLTIEQRLDLSLRLGYFRPEVYAWGW